MWMIKFEIQLENLWHLGKVSESILTCECYNNLLNTEPLLYDLADS